jgi:hypothetical protein
MGDLDAIVADEDAARTGDQFLDLGLVAAAEVALDQRVHLIMSGTVIHVISVLFSPALKARNDAPDLIS